MYSLFTSSWNFNDPWIGHLGLVENGLHGYRMKAAAACAAFRRWQVAWRRNPHAKAVQADGYVAIPDFLPNDVFGRLLKEVHDAAEQVREICPVRDNRKPGFQPQEHHAWGYDRFDGGTLNRFIKGDAQKLPELHAFSRRSELSNLSRLIVGLPIKPQYVRIYETYNGDEERNHDIQKDFHRDTFFSSMKFWYFLEPVEEDDGPFVYVPGSHKLDRPRMQWENAQARAAVNKRLKTGSAGGGSFRITEEEMSALGLPAPKRLTVAANTMVIADTLGFHRRGDAKPGRRRLSLYSSMRPAPFLPFGL